MKYVVRVKHTHETRWYAFNSERYPDDAAGLARAKEIARRQNEWPYTTSRREYAVFRYLGGKGLKAKYERVE